MMKVTLLLALVATLVAANPLTDFKQFVKDHTFTREEAAEITRKHKFDRVLTQRN